MHGDIQANSLTADLTATTIEGGITFSTTGSAQANSLHGSIAGSIGSVSWMGTRHIDTGFGNVDLQIPANANLMVQVSAFRGVIQSDFSIPVMTTFFGQSNRATATLDTGGRALKLSTFDGNITLRQGSPSGQ